MALILPNQLLVLNAYALLVDETPGNTAYAEHQAFIAANGASAYASALDSIFTATSTASLATTMLANLGLSSIFTQADGEAYLAANSGNRVGAMLDLANLLVNYSGADAALVLAKSTYVATLNDSYAYSSNTSNLAGASLSDDGAVTNTFELTAGTDRVTGTSAADFFEAFLSQNSTAGGISNTLSSADRVDGGAGADSLYAELVPEFFGETGNNQIDVQPRIAGVETIEFEARDFGGSSVVSSGGTSTLEGSNTVTVDAKNITGVNSIGSTFSDGDLVIENLTTLTDSGVARNTDAITITMDHTDNFNTDEDASDLHVYFDDDYLLAGQVAEAQAFYFLLDELAELEGNTNRLNRINVDGIKFSLDGVNVIDLDSPDAQSAGTHQGFVNALQANLAALIAAGTVPAGTTLTLDPTITDVTFLDDGSQSDLIPAIVLTSGDGTVVTPVGFSQFEDAIGEYDVYGTFNSDAQVTNQPITVNIDLDKVGRNGEGGDLVIGGKEQNNDTSGNQIGSGDSNQTSGTPGGITVFRVDVLGTVDRPSNLGTLTSTNGELETVMISTHEDYVAGGSYASLTIRDGFGPVSDDLKLVNADAFLGDLALGEEIAVVNLDTLTAQGGGDVFFNGTVTGAEENQAYSYTTGAGNDEVIVTISGDATDYALSSVNVATGAGDDEVTIETEMTDGQDNQILNQVILQNIMVQTGAGDDIVTLASGSEGDTIIETAAGDDVIYTDGGSATAVWAFNYDDARTDVTSLAATATDNLPGVQTSLAYLAGATVRVTFSGAGLADAAGGGVMAVSDVDGDTNLLADAFADGYESSVVIGSLINGRTYFGDQRDINAAILTAINSDDVLNKLLVASISTNNTVVVRSLTSGAFNTDDLEITLVQAAAGSAARASAVLAEAETVFSNSLLTLADLWTNSGAGATDTFVGAGDAGAFDTLTSQADLSVYYTGLGVDQATIHTGGAASELETDNVINGGADDDVIVLSTDATPGALPAFTLGSNNSMLNLASNETIVMEDLFGDDTVMNFTATDVTAVGTPAVPTVFTYDFTGLTVAVGGAGNISVGGVVVALADGDTGADIATKVQAILAGDPAFSGFTVVVAGGTTVTVTDPTGVLDIAVSTLEDVVNGGVTLVAGAFVDGTETTDGTPEVVASGFGGIDFLDFGDYLTSTESPSGSTASTVLIPVAMDNTVLTDDAATGVGANDVVVVRFDNAPTATETFSGLSASVIASLFNDQTGTTAVTYGNFDDGDFTVLDAYDDSTTGTADVDLVSGAAKAVVMVENADNLGEYKLFELSWYAGVSNATSAHTVTAVEIGSLDFGTTLTGLGEVNLVGSVDYAAILANGINNVVVV